MSNKKHRVVYFYDEEVGDYLYNDVHPMKPHRIAMAHNLILAYELNNYMTVKKPRRATPTDMTRFHTDEYIQFLQLAPPSIVNLAEGDNNNLNLYNISSDSPIFPGLFEFCQISAGGSIQAAEELNSGNVDIAINWAGGLHHAKKAEASGFCYVADCVLGILKLLERYQRVMSIDIDIHHGDGVEEAFYVTDRCLTVSFHKYGKYFPGTGDIKDIGVGRGKYYTINVPLKEGMDDESFISIFKSVIDEAVSWYKPEAILLQCGADSLRGDRIGCFNLTIKGHTDCVKHMVDKKIPLLVTGGGGYTVRNVARCWAYETAVILDKEVSNALPFTDYLGYYGPDYQLHLQPSNMVNANKPEELQRIVNQIVSNIRAAPPTPCAGMDEADNYGLLIDSDSSDFDEKPIDFFAKSEYTDESSIDDS